MRNFVSMFIVAIFLGQSLLSSYMYAAQPAATQVEKQNSQNANQELITKFLKMDVSNIDAISVLQVAAYLYVYEKNGIAWFDFEKWDDSQAIMTVNYFISMYAPNVWFLANDRGWDENYFSNKANVWKSKYPEQYTKVYNYAKDAQLKYAMPAAPAPAPVAAPAPAVDQQKNPAAPVDTSKNPAYVSTQPKDTEKNTKFGENCDAMYAKLMKEYDSLIAIKDIEYAKIADVKQRISDVQSGKWCVVAAAVATQQDVQKENQSVVEQVRKTLNFGSANMKVIPDNIVPTYCEDTSSNELRNQLLDIDGQTIKSMKTDLDSLIQSEELGDSLIKRNVLNFVSQELWLVDSVQSTQQWDATSVFHNMTKWLILIGDSIANTRWVYGIIDLANVNIDKLSEIGNFIGKEFDGIKSLKTKGNSDYSWDKNIGTFTRADNSDGVIRFKLPASKNTATNNATFTLATARTRTIQVSEKPYTWTEYKWDISLEQFTQEARNNGSMRWNQMDATTLGKALTQEIIAYVPDYYTYNDPNQPTIFFAEANGEQKVFKDANLTAVMPAGKFSNPRWTTYVIGEEGKLVAMYYNEEAPEQIKAKLEVDGKIIAGIDLAITYDEEAIRNGHGSSFPLKVNARVYIADYLITFSANRSLNQDLWSLSTAMTIQWPSICNFSLSATIQYTHDGAQGYPSIEGWLTNIQEASATLAFNSNTITIDVSDVAWFVSSADAAVSASIDENMLDVLIPVINQYVSAAYYFDDNKLADILPDAENMVIIQYTNNGTTEAIMDTVWSYMHLLRTDTIMNFIQQYTGGWDKQYDDKPANMPWDDNKDSGEQTVSDPVLKVNNYYQDGEYIYVSHIYYDNNGNPSEVHPDKISVEVMTAAGAASYQFEMVDMYTYRSPVAYILSDPSIYAAYIYASYNSYGSTYYIVGSSEQYNGWNDVWSYASWSSDSWSVYQEPTNLYTLQWQSTSYPDVQTQEIVLSLYNDGMFVQYIEPTVVLYMSYGSDCKNNPNACTYSNINLYPTYLNGVPTYIVDTMQLDDMSVYEASVSMIYTDPSGYEHNEQYGLKKPLQ